MRETPTICMMISRYAILKIQTRLSEKQENVCSCIRAAFHLKLFFLIYLCICLAWIKEELVLVTVVIMSILISRASYTAIQNSHK